MKKGEKTTYLGYLGILSFFVILGSICIYYIYIRYLDEPRFLSKEDTYKLLSSDSDGYYAGFNKNDLRVRRASSVKEYINTIRGSCSEFTEREKKLLKDYSRLAKERLRSAHEPRIGFDSIKASNIPVVFGCTDGYDYEEGLPHTRHPAIIISRLQLDESSAEFMTRLIIHELTHLYQKMYPDDMKQYLKDNGFEVVRRRRAEDNIRANPDIDGFVYKNTLTDKTYEFIYNDSPQSIGDIMQRQRQRTREKEGSTPEHPFEEMAYQMENVGL